MISVYSLSNNLFAVDQFVNNKANPYYICESLSDFKLATKYLLIFRPEIHWDLEVQCHIHGHFAIKAFLEREKEHLKFEKGLSTNRHQLFIGKDGKCIYVSYWGNMKGKWESHVNSFKRDGVTFYSLDEIKNENEFYWSLVIYESVGKFKLHNIEFADRI